MSGEPRILDPETEHFIKNHLAVITGFCELLLSSTPPDDPRYNDIEEINRSARELVDLFRSRPSR